jgi:hypothetical protein
VLGGGRNTDDLGADDVRELDRREPDAASGGIRKANPKKP